MGRKYKLSKGYLFDSTYLGQSTQHSAWWQLPVTRKSQKFGKVGSDPVTISKSYLFVSLFLMI